MRCLTRALLLTLFWLPGTHAQTLDQMRFSALALSPVLSLSQTLETRLRLTNRSQTAMYVYKDLAYFNAAWAYAGSGERMDKHIIEELRPPPIQRSDLIILKPGQYVEHIRQDDLGQLGIRKPGQYRIDFNYSPAIHPAFTFGLPVWLGMQHASVVIRVVD